MVSSRQSGAPSRDRSRDEKKKASRKPSSTGEARNDRLRLFDRAAASVVVFRELAPKKKKPQKSETKKPPRFSRELDRMPPRAGVRRTRVGRARGCRDRQNDGSASCDERAAGNLASLLACERVGSSGRVPRGARVSAVPAGDASGDDRPLVAVHGVRGEDFLVLLLGERPALHRGVELVAPPARKE